MKRIVWSWVGLVFGALMIVGAAFALFDDTVTCGGKTMKQGDVCVREKNGTVVSESNLEESKTDGLIGKIVGIGFGVALVAVGAVNLRAGLRNRKAAAHQAQNPMGFGHPGMNHPAPGPWNQVPGAPQANHGWPGAPQADQGWPGAPQVIHGSPGAAQVANGSPGQPQAAHGRPQHQPTQPSWPPHQQPPQHGWQQQPNQPQHPPGQGGGAWS